MVGANVRSLRLGSGEPGPVGPDHSVDEQIGEPPRVGYRQVVIGVYLFDTSTDESGEFGLRAGSADSVAGEQEELGGAGDTGPEFGPQVHAADSITDVDRIGRRGPGEFGANPLPARPFPGTGAESGENSAR